jgi:hypothetical protein
MLRASRCIKLPSRALLAPFGDAAETWRLMLRGGFRRRLSSFAKTSAGSVELKISASGLFSSDSTLLRARIFDTPTGQACWLPPFATVTPRALAVPSTATPFQCAGAARQLPARDVAANASRHPPIQPATRARARAHAPGCCGHAACAPGRNSPSPQPSPGTAPRCTAHSARRSRATSCDPARSQMVRFRARVRARVS